ncbi:HDIG domain-containing protein [Geosporobacter subterraneus DSM 17957]|uniref:HDIG domain-containing protein n=1 Tax=Geosporobacter subterraneus DSM 17957 TaxID=1121919 RepID=A0A1M6IBM4_9FIRM|nr:HD-GYP domain-containing protein [Geosporobacter subterraneus]SHJ31892.1 HDIG domain-containing protein [Geosporobacter subterraneus DSM 17957]
MKRIHINELCEGMILGEDIVGKYDIVLITSGTILTDKHIDSLKKIHLSYVFVMETEDSNVGDDIQNDNISPSVIIVDRKLNIEYHKSMKSFKDMYHDLGLGKKIEKEVVDKSVTPLIDEVLSHNNVLGRLRQIETGDAYTFNHSMDVCILSTMIGKWMNYSTNDLNRLATAALLHDVGKGKIPAEILNKPGPLTAEEFEIMKKHAILGYEIVKGTEGIDHDICCGILQHHERMNGSGYPFGIKGDRIHEFAKIIAVADIFDAMTSNRVYKTKESPFKVAEILAESSFASLDPYIANVFLSNISKFYVGNIVKLSTGEVGEIVLLNQQVPTKPLVKTDKGFIDLLKQREIEIIDVIA